MTNWIETDRFTKLVLDYFTLVDLFAGDDPEIVNRFKPLIEFKGSLILWKEMKDQMVPSEAMIEEGANNPLLFPILNSLSLAHRRLVELRQTNVVRFSLRFDDKSNTRFIITYEHLFLKQDEITFRTNLTELTQGEIENLYVNALQTAQGQ